jgi:hypothetical protein
MKERIMKTLFRLFAFVLVVASLVACNLTQAKPTDTQVTLNPNEIATQVQQMLASVPAVTQLPTQAIIQPQATATQVAAPPAATNTPTPVIQTSPSATSQATPTGVLNTATATPPPTSNAADPRGTLGTPTRADTFENNQFWFPFSDDHTKISIANGSLGMTAINPDGWTGWTLTSPAITDFYLEITAKPTACDGLDSYGPILRSPDATHGYLFAVSCDGQYRFEKVDGNNFSDLIKWTANPAIKKGADQSNRLGVMAKGSQFTLFVNGTQVDQVSDSSYGSGVFGLFISSFKTANFTVQVDEVDYWNQP